MCGVLDVRAAMTPKLTLGYPRRRRGGSVLARAGDVQCTATSCRRTAAHPAAGPQPAWKPPPKPDGHIKGNVVASYLHTH